MDDNPYKSPLAMSGLNDAPRRPFVQDAPGWFALLLAGVMFSVVIFGAVGGAILAAPANRYQSLPFGCIYAAWGAVWLMSARAWWKGRLTACLIWMAIGLAPFVIIVVGLI